MTPLYIIPARGGSKGIPRKNIKPLAGKPLICYSIDTARALGADDRHIVLSTDDDEIAAVARRYGLPIDYRRPAALATDTAGSREVIIDAMDYADRSGIGYDCVVLLQPTSPLRDTEDVTRCIDLYARTRPDMAVTTVQAADNPYYNCFETDPEGCLHVSKGEGLYTRRQDAPPAWAMNGAVYVINPASIRKYSLGAMPRRVGCEMPRERSVDLDTPLDWVVAEAILTKKFDL